ncbi:MAG TPA: glutamine-hydrolyzing carbamoyl-phosphate synthase small subunit [Thermoanaerobaculia bacterium]
MQPLEPHSGLLLLEDGSVFEGRATTPGTRFGEVVFNTSMTGYQEVLTDPSYHGQIVVMTQPHIGNYGVSGRAAESGRAWVEGFVARKFTREPSGEATEREDGGLLPFLRRSGVPSIDGIDTRALVRRLREHGALRGVLTTERSDVDALAAELADFPPMAGRALVDAVTCDEPRELPAEGEERFHLAVYDFGAKRNILRSLTRRGARVTVLPARTPAAGCLALDPAGIVLSNGPGDPEPLPGIIGEVGELARSGRPVFGICLGHQLLGLALGGRTFKLKFGHHGGNQPVQELATGKVAITSQNHGFSVDPESLPPEVRPTHVNLNDGTLEGLEVEGRPVFAAQYHPEAAPGPHEAAAQFDRFLGSIRGRS